MKTLSTLWRRVLLSSIILVVTQLDAQIISHELRRLAISTNQFGIDALRALDRIESPNKVIVFCPICLSSSLMMIMMGSSKYQVVSSFKQALYVWTLKPTEINRGFRDVFEHLGLNQQQSSPKIRSSITPLADTKSYYKSSIEDDSSGAYLSLPDLMRLKEFVDRGLNENPWWTSINTSNHQDSSRYLRETSRGSPSVNLSESEVMDNHNNVSISERYVRDSNELSQMKAVSNIYIQRGLNMNYNYNLLLRQYYKTVIHPVDFFRNAEETRQHINSLVSSNTEGKIKELVKKESFGNILQPKIMIISTFHFRATLDVQIKSNYSSNQLSDKNSRSTSEKNEILDENQYSSVKKNKYFIETEESLLKFGVFSNLDCSVIEIPFSNRLVSLIIIMPNNQNSTELLITKLSAQVLSDMINSLVVKKISIEIPVIKFDRGQVNVDGLLRELGLSQYFFGNRVHTTETGLNKWMKPSDIVHETSIDIGTINPNFFQIEDRLKVGAHDEQQANPPMSQVNNKPPHQIKKRRSRNQNDHVKLDKSFLYFVLDSINGLVLTMGRIRQ